jgi:hypothetical protein
MGLYDLKAFRGNFLIAFAGAGLIIFMIKLTPLLLPAKYYFSFSKLMASGSEPFIVDPPGVTGQKLCALMEKYDIPNDRFPNSFIDCSLSYAQDSSSTDSSQPPFSPQQKDRIYTIALQGDPQVRGDLKAMLEHSAIAFPTDADVALITSQTRSVSTAFEKLFESYRSSLNDVVEAAVGNKVEESFAADAVSGGSNATDHGPGGEATTIEESIGEQPRLSAETSAKVLAAYQKAALRLGQTQLATAVKPITKSEVDKAIKHSYGWDGVDDSIVDYYKRSLSDEFVHGVLMEEFKNAGLSVKTPDEDRRLIFAEINKFSLLNYVVAIVVRLLPVVLFGVVMGIVFGRGEVLSIAIAGGIAAFLLSWPLMLMWDRLVQSSWLDKKTVFLIFYAGYILAFFITARASAMFGAKIRQRMRPDESPAPGAADGTAAETISWAGIITNAAAAVVANVLVYIGNVIIPLQAMAND